MRASSHSALVTLVSAIAVFLEIMAGWNWFYLPNLGNFLFFHAMSSAVILTVCAWIFGPTHNKNNLIFLFGFWCFIPVMGPVVASIIFFKMYNHEEPSPKAILNLVETKEAEDEFFRNLTVELITERYRRSQQREGEASLVGAAVVPFIDILGSNDLEAKKKVIRRLRFSRTREAIRLLRLAQNDSTYEIRYLATIAISGMEQDWHNTIKVLRKEISRDPNNLHYRNELIFTYTLMFDSELIPDSLLKIYLRHAFEEAKISLALKADQPDILVHTGKMYLIMKDYEKAEAVFSQAVEMQPSDIAYRFWRAEAQYYLQHFDKLRRECRQLLDTSKVSSRISPNVSYWGQAYAAG